MENEIKTRLKGINKLLEGQGFTAVYKSIFKNNRNRDAVVLKAEEDSCCPVIYFDDRVWKGTDQEIAGYLKKFFQEYGGDRDVEELQSKEYILEHVLPRVVRDDSIPGLERGGVAYVPLMDMAVYFYVPLREALEEDATLSSFNILDDMLKQAGIGLDELYQAAKDNAGQECRICPIENMIMGFLGLPVPEGLDPDRPKILVVTNRWGVLGSGMVASSSVMEKVAGMLGDRFLILPSSIHELICVPAAQETVSCCADMVAQINAEHVHPDEQLTDSVYVWDKGDLECCPHKGS